MAPPPAETIRTALLVGAVVVLGWLAWQIADVLLLVFASVLFAIVLRSIAGPLERHTPVRAPWSLVLAGVFLAAVVAVFFFILGAQVRDQATAVVDELPDALASFGQRIGIENLPQRLVEQAERLTRRSAFAERIAGYASGFLDAAASVLLVVIAGIYLAADPQRYRRGVTRLLPKERQPEAKKATQNLARALKLWLLGQLISMALVGTLTTLGLYAIGMPSALALGLLAGLAEFVPLIGPVLSAVPAILLALSEGGSTVLWVIGLYIGVQQIESNVIMPLVQRKVVDLPPVLTLFSILGFGILFGPLGILLGTPLAVATYVLVKQLYIRDALHQETEVPGASD